MSLATIFLAPLALLLPATGGEMDDARLTLPAGQPVEIAGEASTFKILAQGFRVEEAHQMRIERRVTIRVIPRPAPAAPNALADLPRREVGPRFKERKIGKCLPVSGISGVQVDPRNRLILFMRDHRMVSAELERACRARDFYSGFYLAPSRDGLLCVDRDPLLSRNGANCRLARIRQLIEADD